MLDHDGEFFFVVYRGTPGLGELEGNDIRQRLLRDDDAGGVGTCVAGEPLYLEGGVEDLLGGLILRYELHDLACRTGVFLSGDVGAVLGTQHVAERGPDGFLGDELGELVGIRVGILVDPSRVPDGGLRADGPERDDLGNVLVAAVLVRDVAHHLRAARDREVYVHIGHVDAVGVQETLEEQRVFQGVQVRDLERVGDDGAGRRTPSGPYRDLPVLRILDEVPHDQEVVRKTHLPDGPQLELQPAEYLLALRPPTVTLSQAPLALLPQVLVGRVPFRLREVRQTRLAELYPYVLDALDNL